MAQSTDSPLCPDWLILNNANVHVAKDRGWFKTYTPFASTIDASPLFKTNPSSQLPVVGIGSVEISTKRSPNLSGVSSHGTLLLSEVLHVPGSLCNFIGQPLWKTDGYSATIGGSGTKSKGGIKDSQGRNVAYFDPKSPLFAIKLRHSPDGPALGPHVIKDGTMYMLGVRWDAAERRRWEDFKAGNDSSTSGPNAARYTDEEKAFLKKNYGSEYHFLMQHGLKILDDEDRAVGRAILRAIMSEDETSENEMSKNETSENATSEDEESDEFAQFEGHQADYNFTELQLDWIEKHYRNSEQFMICYGLKWYNDEDVQEAKVIVDAMMDDEDEEQAE